MGKLKLIIPVVTTTGSTTILSVRKIPEVFTLIDLKGLAEHILSQKENINKGERYKPFLQQVPADKFNQAVSAIKRKQVPVKSTGDIPIYDENYVYLMSLTR